MFKKTIYLWNFIHYSIFLAVNTLTFLLLYPFFKLMGSAKVRRLYERRGIMDHEEQIKDALVNPDNSANIIKAGGVMGIIMLFYLTGLWCIYTGLFLENFTLTIVHIFAIGLVTFTINYLFLFKDGVYLNYFAEFNMLTKGKKKTYHFISLIL